ncbi:MAG: hypothetical protein ACRDNJ_09815, partial [Solirubrobacteraceae bacterium]
RDAGGGQGGGAGGARSEQGAPGEDGLGHDRDVYRRSAKWFLQGPLWSRSWTTRGTAITG